MSSLDTGTGKSGSGRVLADSAGMLCQIAVEIEFISKGVELSL